MFELIDVTLRDGGNRIDFNFTETDIIQILTLLNSADLDYIEVGYRKGAISLEMPNGLAGWCEKDYLLSCRNLLSRSKLALMAHPERLSQSDLLEFKEINLDLLRLCLTKANFECIKKICSLGQRCDLNISVNIIHISQYSNAALSNVVGDLNHLGCKIVYFADSNGSLFPDKIYDLYNEYVSRYPFIKFGFHAHDTLGLAQANTLAAIKAGVKFIDCSLSGMGKGIGNLRTEYFIAYLEAICDGHYDLNYIVKAANYVRNKFRNELAYLDFQEFDRGIHDLSTAEMKRKFS